MREEHELLDRGEQRPLSPKDRERLDSINVRLDQYYDLLRQRRALREAGLDPNAAHERDASTVEKYLQ